MDIKFILVRQAVGVSVLVAVNCSIPIRVLNGRVGAKHVYLDPVVQSVFVGVGDGRIGGVRVDLIAVA